MLPFYIFAYIRHILVRFHVFSRGRFSSRSSLSCAPSESVRSLCAQSAMDMFANALIDVVEVGVETQLMPTTAPSQVTATGCPSSVTSSVETIVLRDDEEERSISTGSPMVRGMSAGKPSVDTKRKVANTPKPEPTKRPRLSQNSLSLKPVNMIDAEDVMCVFVDRGECTVPVPLWHQYMVSWRDADFADSKWIVVSNYERWVMQVVDAVTCRSVRQVAKAFADKLKTEFLTCLAKARRPGQMENLFEDDNSDDKAGQCRLRERRVDAVLKTNIGGFNVFCLNHAARMVLKLDRATAKFISAWVVPLVRELARSQAQCPSSPESVASISTDTVAGFQFCASTTPNIRDKVQWNPLKHLWEILLKKPKGALSGQFRVDPGLSAALYEEEKVVSYHRAIEAWNSHDGSTRHRIPLACHAASGSD